MKNDGFFGEINMYEFWNDFKDFDFGVKMVIISWFIGLCLKLVILFKGIFLFEIKKLLFKILLVNGLYFVF